MNPEMSRVDRASKMARRFFRSSAHLWMKSHHAKSFARSAVGSYILNRRPVGSILTQLWLLEVKM
jgi:hypothetical protein